MAEKAYINPRVFRWARETARMSLEVAAKKVSVPVERVIEWEDGTTLPTVGQAEKLAHAYRRSFAILFLPEVPADFQTLQDFRKSANSLGTASTFAIRDVQQKQAWVRELYEETGEPIRSYVGKFTAQSDPNEVAADILATLQIDPANYPSQNHLKTWISKAEENGVFVAKTSFINSRLTLDSDEFQGFAIADRYAPFVFLNTNDWPAPQLFTLVHELAHIWIDASGISGDIELKFAAKRDTNAVELFCNEVAAAALMPELVMHQIKRTAFTSPAAVFNAARRLGISSFALLVRALRLQIIGLEQYQQFKKSADADFEAYKLREESKRAKMKLKDGGPNFYQTTVDKNSRLFTQIVIDAYRGGIIQPTQASNLLSTRVNRIPQLEAVIYA